MKLNYNLNSQSSDSELLPLIDVMFILVVFLMLFAGNVLFSINVNLPSGKSKDPLQGKPTIIQVYENSITLNNKEFNEIDSISIELVESQNLSTTIMLAVDSDITSGRLIGIISKLKSNGFNKVGVLIENEK